MTRHPRRGRSTVAFAVGGAALLLTAACGGSSAGTTAAGSGSGSTASAAGSGAAAGVHVATTSLGKSVVAGNGRTLYLLTSDKNGATTCTGGCLQLWPPVMVPAAGAPKASGVSGALGTLGRGAAKQLTIAGHPVYLYAADTKAGDTSGEGITSYGGTWWAVSPSGAAIKSAGSTGGTRGGY